MGNLDLPDHYRRKIESLIYEYNRPLPLPFYFSRLIRSKKEVKIADLGSGPICTLGTIWGKVKVTIYASDLRQKAYAELLEKVKCTPLTPIEYQDMENLTYPDNFFDIVHCVNALDHTQEAQKAIMEMKRVCKPEGYIYLRHIHSQRSVNNGNGHYWDARADGFYGANSKISIDEFITTDDGFFIVSVMRKKQYQNI
jgi:SAM-dependent methyltransferase